MTELTVFGHKESLTHAFQALQSCYQYRTLGQDKQGQLRGSATSPALRVGTPCLSPAVVLYSVRDPSEVASL
jgi:hypothetical protein